MPFFQTLHGKLSAALLALLVLVGVLLFPLTLYAVRCYTEEVAQQLNRPLAGDLARHLETKDLLRADFASDGKLRAGAKREIGRLMVLNPDIEIYVTNAQGEILAYSAKVEKLPVESLDLAPVQAFLAGQALPIRGADPLHPGGRKVFSAARIADGNAVLNGYVYIVLGSQAYQSVALFTGRSYALRTVLWIMAGALTLVFGAGVLLFRVLTRRLHALQSEMSAFSTRFAAPPAGAPPRPARDEIEKLEQGFAALANCVSAHVAARERAETSRRELMGNISHDLRTPLAALQGYLETLQMKDAALSPAQRERYLEVAMRRAARLNTLIGSLFELAKLDAGEAKPQLEAFSLAELVQDEVQQFALAAQTKGVQLQTQLPDDLPMVWGDIGLIERALENLLDNALRHTEAGGAVCVALAPCQENGRRCARVQVRDSGAGIAPEILPHIFERSFRANSTDQGAGLGLAITKRILELHGSSVEVSSAPGQGAAFSFRLWTPPESSSTARFHSIHTF